MQEELETLVAHALREPGVDALLELAAHVSRHGAPADLQRPELIRRTLTALWRDTSRRRLADLALRLLGMEPVRGADAAVPHGDLRWEDREGEAWDPASGLPARARHPGSGQLLGLVLPGSLEVAARSGWARGLSLPAFWLGVRPVTVREYAAWYDSDGVGSPKRAPEDWDVQRVDPDEPVRGLSARQAVRYAESLGLRLPIELEWERALGGPHGARRYRIPADKAVTQAGWFGHEGLLGVAWQWARVDHPDTRRHGPVRSERGHHYVGRGGVRTRGADEVLPGERAIDRGRTPPGFFGVRLARDLFPPPAQAAWELPTAAFPEKRPVWVPGARPGEERVEPARPEEGRGPSARFGSRARRAGGPVRGLLFLPGGRLLFAADSYRIGLWDAATGEHLPVPRSLAEASWPLALSPDGTRLASADDRECRLEIRDAATLDLVGTIENTGRDLADLAFFEDPDRLVAVEEDGTVLRVPLDGGEAEVFTVERDLLDQVRVIRDGTRALLCGARRVRVQELVEDAGPARELLTFTVGAELGASADRQDWVLARRTRQVGELFLEHHRGDTDERVGEPGACNLPVGAMLAVSPDARRAVVVGGDRIRLESTVLGAGGLAVAAPDGAMAAAWEPRGETVAVSSVAGRVRLLDARTGEERDPPGGLLGAARDLALGPEGAAVFLVDPYGELGLQRWEPGGEAPSSAVPAPQGRNGGAGVNRLALSPHGGDLAVGRDDGSVHIRLAADLGVETARIRTGCGSIGALAWDERRQCLVAAGYRGVEVWLREERELQVELPRSRGGGLELEVSACGRTVVAALGATLHVGRVDRRGVDWQESALGARIETIAASADGTTTAALLAGGDVFVLGRDGNPVRIPAGRPGARACVLALSPDGLHVARGREDGRIEVLDLRRRREPRMLRDHVGAVDRLVFDSTGRFLASAGLDTVVCVWDLSGPGEAG